MMAVGENLPVRLTRHPDHDHDPSWSRDGEWVYFSSTRSGQWQIWRIRMSEGEAIQLTRNGGLRPLEGPKGRFLYFQKPDKDGIWRVPVEGGEESLVVESYKYWLKGYWALGEDRVYFVDLLEGGHYALHSHDLLSGRVRHIARIDGPVANSAPGLAITSDETKALITMRKSKESEIVMVKDWRRSAYALDGKDAEK